VLKAESNPVGPPTLYTRDDLCRLHGPDGVCSLPDYLPAQLQPYWQCSRCEFHFCEACMVRVGTKLLCELCKDL